MLAECLESQDSLAGDLVSLGDTKSGSLFIVAPLAT
jgi:hypothetical protein